MPVSANPTICDSAPALQARAARGAAACALSMLLLATCGCFAERTFEAELTAIRPVVLDSAAAGAGGVRPWLAAAREQLSPLLPARHLPPLISGEFADPDGKPIDVYRHFRTDPAALGSLFGNFYGLQHTAQCSHGPSRSERPPEWPGFADVCIPVADGVRLFGRLGLARRNGRPLRGDCIIVLPGLLGDLHVERTRTIAEALVNAGLHALAVELRGAGRTDAVQPTLAYTFGVLETGDPLAVAEWLQSLPDVRRTGVIGFCWGANLALLAAWEDGRGPAPSSVTQRLRPHLRPASGQRHFEAGVLAFSPVLSFEAIVERCERPATLWTDPVLHALQDRIRERKRDKGIRPVNGSLRGLIEAEFARSSLNYREAVTDGLDYLRLLPLRGRPAGDKLREARVPVLIVHASNDPTASAQAVAELAATVSNPNVGVMMLEGGGHVGFAAYARDWFYSLILAFFGRGLVPS